MTNTKEIKTKITKKFTLIRIKTHEEDYEMKVELTYGPINGYWDMLKYPQETFDTEDEAIAYLKDNENYLGSIYMCVPVYIPEIDYD